MGEGGEHATLKCLTKLELKMYQNREDTLNGNEQTVQEINNDAMEILQSFAVFCCVRHWKHFKYGAYSFRLLIQLT